jgi:hypothetical protein
LPRASPGECVRFLFRSQSITTFTPNGTGNGHGTDTGSGSASGKALLGSAASSIIIGAGTGTVPVPGAEHDQSVRALLSYIPLNPPFNKRAPRPNYLGARYLSTNLPIQLRRYEPELSARTARPK